MSEADVPVLDLPNRWEKLKRRAGEVELDASEFVEPVETASKRVDHLLDLVRSSGGGVFEIVLGLSGSGKTTFVNTLPRFFEGIEVFSVPHEMPLTSLKDFIQSKYVVGRPMLRVFLIERRDNPSVQDIADARSMLSTMLDFFRTPEGTALVLWTITDEEAALDIAGAAWTIGRDSLVDFETKGIYRFEGLEKNKYPRVADDTAKNLTGDGLAVFGLTHDVLQELLHDCSTISDYYGRLVRKSRQVQGATWSVLKERVHPKLWILLPGDTREAINSTVRALTQGTRSRIDVDLLREFIDDSNNDAQYAKEWKARRSSLAHIFRALDVRLFSMPPNVAVAAVRCFGDSALKGRLQSPVAARSQSVDALRKTRIYKEILQSLNIAADPFAERGSISESTKDEYRRMQMQAENSDKPLNKALGELFRTALLEDAPSAEIHVEKKSIGVPGLQPDIYVKLSDVDIICIEPTWRSSGTPITGQAKERQNTLAEGHMKQYILNKALDYVKAIGL
jgi:hypothetical protein